MKSGREAALTKRSTAKPRNITLPKEAMKILVKLERAKNFNSKRKYNKELDKLIVLYPEMQIAIEEMKIK